MDGLSETAIEAWREGFRGIVPDHVDPRRAWSRERVAERLRGPGDGSYILAAEVDGRICGLCLMGPSRDVGAPRSEAEIVALYVRPDHWRSGIGRALVTAALDRFVAEGYEEAIVWTLAESPRNIAFYEALGFRLDGGTQRRPSFGSPLEVRFRLPLGERRAGGDQ